MESLEEALKHELEYQRDMVQMGLPKFLEKYSKPTSDTEAPKTSRRTPRSSSVGIADIHPLNPGTSLSSEPAITAHTSTPKPEACPLLEAAKATEKTATVKKHEGGLVAKRPQKGLQLPGEESDGTRKRKRLDTKVWVDQPLSQGGRVVGVLKAGKERKRDQSGGGQKLPRRKPLTPKHTEH